MQKVNFCFSNFPPPSLSCYSDWSPCDRVPLTVYHCQFHSFPSFCIYSRSLRGFMYSPILKKKQKLFSIQIIVFNDSGAYYSPAECCPSQNKLQCQCVYHPVCECVCVCAVRTGGEKQNKILQKYNLKRNVIFFDFKSMNENNRQITQ